MKRYTFHDVSGPKHRRMLGQFTVDAPTLREAKVIARNAARGYAVYANSYERIAP